MRNVRSFSILMLLAVAGFSTSQENNLPGARDQESASMPAKIAGIDRPFWAPNRIGDYITNVGQIISFHAAGNLGMEWPAGSGKRIGFASGIWLAGMKDNEIVTAVGEYTTEYQPGNVIGHTPANSQDARFKVYIINDEDITNPAGNPDYLNWPAADGAPLGADGKPLLLGTSTAWAVFNDFNDTLHTRLFETEPMGVEVQMTAWAFDRADALGDMMFFKFKFINKSGAGITNAYAAFWADFDIGWARDLVGCDTALALGYQYKTQADEIYGDNSPAIGYEFLQGPIIPSPGDTASVSGRRVAGFKNLPMTSFRTFICGGPPDFSCPDNSSEAYHFMEGLNGMGQPILNPITGLATRFSHTGDPVAGTGWLDSNPGDRYFLMSSGPFQFADGDTQEVVCAIIIAQGSTGLESVQLLRQNVGIAQLAYLEQLKTTGVEETPGPLPVDYSLKQNYPNPFNPSTSFEFSIPRDEFVSLKIYNLLGEEVTVVVAERLAGGKHKVNWNASGLPGGVFFYRFQAGDFVQRGKLMLIR